MKADLYCSIEMYEKHVKLSVNLQGKKRDSQCEIKKKKLRKSGFQQYDEMEQYRYN